MIEHKGVISLTEDLTVKYNLREDQSILLFANTMFDASVEQMMLALLNGHKLAVINADLLLNDNAFCNYLNSHQITPIHVPPAFLGNFDLSQVMSLRRLISGEEC